MRRHLPALLVLAFATLGLFPPASGAFPRKCPARAHTVATDAGAYSRLWTANGALYGCIKYGGETPRGKRLGPWTRGGAVDFTETTAVWTTTVTRRGRRSDRVWAADAYTGKRFLSGKLLVPATASTKEAEGRVQGVVAGTDGAAAWVTRSGEVGVALDRPYGDGDPSLADGGEVRPDGNRALLGRFVSDPARLLASQKIEQDEGEGDECGGAYDVTFSVADPPVQLTWRSSYPGPFPDYC